MARELWDRLPVALCRTAAGGRMVDANQECVALLGYPNRASLLQAPPQALYVDPLDEERWRALCESGGIVRGFETQLRRADGTSFWARRTAQAVRDEPGTTLYEGSLEDVSERRHAEAQLRRSAETFQGLADSAPSMLLVIVDGKVVYANRKGGEILGVDRGAGAPGLELFQRVAVAPECLDLTREITARREAGEAVPPAEYALVTRDGRRIEGLLTTDLVEHEGGRRLVGYFSDRPARGAVEKALRASEIRYRRLFEAAKDGILILDAETGEVVDVNPFLCELLTLSRQDILGRRIWDLGPFHNVVASKAAFVELQKQEYIRYDDLPLEAAGGRPVEVEFVSNVYRANGHRVIQCNIRDIRERKRTEEERARLIRAIEQLAESVVITDPQGTIVYVNPAFARITGYAREEAVGQNPRILKSGRHDAEFYRQMWETLAAGRVWSGRMINRRKDGTLSEEEAVISPLLDSSNQLVNYVAVNRDITHETRLERQLVQAQRMEAVGRLAGGVAHDFNNLVGVITGYSEIVLKQLPAGEPVREKVEQILKAADRAASLTRQLLAFSRRQVLQPRVLELNAIVLDTEKMLERLIGEDIELVTALGSHLGSIRADRGQVEQIIMNLAVNARDAMPEGGRLTIKTEKVDLDPSAAAGLLMAPGRYVILTVNDTGVGMDGDTQAHMFEPFFTTKEMGRGTGLGLATVYGVVKQSGGYIWVDSEVGVGTTFRVYLPRVNGKAPVEVAPGPPGLPGPLRGGETVLLVEDETMLRDMLRETLEGSGYTVLVARNGAEAPRAAEATAGPIHLMVTDVIMPGLSGPKVVERIAPSRPEMMILYISGYSDESVVRNGMVGPGVAFLSKPFAPEVFLRKVRELLDVPGVARLP
jgi:two-component system, cell cycle sensor histidine kinase and response regulator CckA